MTIENISQSISTEILGRAGIKLETFLSIVFLGVNKIVKHQKQNQK